MLQIRGRCGLRFGLGHSGMLACVPAGLVAIWLLSPTALYAGPSKKTEAGFQLALLGKDVKALVDLPAYKEGLNLYVDTRRQKHLDERGIDLKDLSKYLKEKGVGVERDQWVTITDLKVSGDHIDVELGGGGEGRGASKTAEKGGAGYKRAGGSRVNIRYGQELNDADLQLDNFLPILGRVLDIGKIRAMAIPADTPEEFQDVIRARDCKPGMTYQMVLLSMGEPDQKKVEDSADDTLHETWYYLKNGHRYVVRFLNGKVAKVQVF
jgi:hypothetical protein